MTAQRFFGPVLSVLLIPAAASAERAPDRTGTGGGPASTITAPYTTSTGTTKPPGAGEGPEAPSERRELKRIERENNRIEDGICVGCGR